jgi:hypothetical protein
MMVFFFFFFSSFFLFFFSFLFCPLRGQSPIAPPPASPICLKRELVGAGGAFKPRLLRAFKQPFHRKVVGTLRESGTPNTVLYWRVTIQYNTLYCRESA